jgi:hypothetical protein
VERGNVWKDGEQGNDPYEATCLGLVAVEWNLASVDGDLLAEPGSTSLYSCLPPVFCAAGDGSLDLLYLWDRTWIPSKITLFYKTLEEKGTNFQGVLYTKFFSWGPRALMHHQGTLVEPAVEVSANATRNSSTPAEFGEFFALSSSSSFHVCIIIGSEFIQFILWSYSFRL